MKKRVEKALEYKVATSQKAVGVALVLLCTIIANYGLITQIKTSTSKIFFAVAILSLVFSIMGGILIAIAVPAQLDPLPKHKRKFTTQNPDFRTLTLFQFGALTISIFCILSLLLDLI
ncbi:hypothetical protein SanaruYs_26270 [Chryseotalea sanaruensis]|uniref:Uncharacterized protein n=1 Tax=Chryseotalea sanaruensis TaxID=2482724 RepID=A0A401UBY7_9BACT|nr:hypothetical protein [Chryseotalea sanaruensis]GCC52390.1 hypothetical protein SanaruYs_26270 [Chryseotalea sanaruensis]